MLGLKTAKNFIRDPEIKFDHLLKILNIFKHFYVYIGQDLVFMLC